MRLLLLLLCLASPATAQPFDLETMPVDYQFTDHGHDGNTTVSFEGRDGSAYMFRDERDDSAGSPAIYLSWVNRASQSLRWAGGGIDSSMSPHDCWPSVGGCDFTLTYENGDSFEIHSSMVKIGLYWEHRRYIDVDGVLTLYERGCTLMDEYSFPIDNWTEYWDGDVVWSERVTTMGKPDPRSDLQSLTSFCQNQQDMVS